MLFLANKLNDLSFSALMELYIEGNQENAADQWKHLPEQFALRKVEQDFYLYLKDEFFKTPGAYYAVWQADGCYISALRLEPYQDGLLLEALETHPDYRRQGYAKGLIEAVIQQFSGRKIYSHVNQRNIPSLRTHQACGFRMIMDHAVYIDGSVDYRACTLVYE